MGWYMGLQTTIVVKYILSVVKNYESMNKHIEISEMDQKLFAFSSCFEYLHCKR